MIYTPSTLRRPLSIDIRQFNVPFIIGAPGIGKSAIVKQIAADLDTKAFTLEGGNLSDKADLLGVMRTQTADGNPAQSFYPHQTVQDTIEYAKNNKDKIVLLFIDELNRTDGDVQTGLMSLSTARKIGNVSLPDNVSIILAGNDSGDIDSIDSAKISRSVPYHLEPSAKDLLESKAGQTLVPEIQSWLKADKDNVFSLPEDPEANDDDASKMNYEVAEKFTQFTTPRTIEKLSKFIQGAKEEIVDPNSNETYWESLVQDHQNQRTLGHQSALEQTIINHIGETKAAENFIRMLESKGTAVNDHALPSVPTSVKKVLAEDDIDAIISAVQPQFEQDAEIAERTLVGLTMRHATDNMEDFSLNVAALPALIDSIFTAQPTIGLKLQITLTDQGVISDLAYTTMKDSHLPQVRSMMQIVNGFIQGNLVEIV